MKTKRIAAIIGILAYTIINASIMPDQPLRTLNPIDTVKVVCIYALGEYNNSDSTHYNPQYHPLPSYAFVVWGASPPSVPHYYKEVSAGHFIVETEVWHNNGSSYVVEGFWTPMGDWDQPNLGRFVDSLIARIDRENVWSFADNAMYYPDNDNPGPNDTPFVWVYIYWPEIDGSWGLAPGVFEPWDIQTTETLNGDTVFAHIFGVTRDWRTNRGQAVANIVHEFNHQWFPDIAYNSDHYGLGGFDPQAAGYGFYDDQGGLPSPINPKWRHEAGWIELVDLTGSDHFDRVLSDETMDTLYRLGDFYLSVHRKISYYEHKWPGLGGMLIWHPAHATEMSGFNYGGDEAWRGDQGQGYLDKPLDLEAAHGRWDWDGLTRTTPNPVDGRDNLDMKPWGYYEQGQFHGKGDSLCFFWPDYGYTQFDGLTNPSSRGHKFNMSNNRNMGERKPQEIAVRRLAVAGNNAMKADLLYNYCIIASNYPGIPIHSGATNQRSLGPSLIWYGPNNKRHQTYAIAYVDNDPMLWIRLGGFTALPTVKRQLVYQDDSAGYPALYSHGVDNKQLAICWLDGSSLYYRHGYKYLVTDSVTWDNNPYDLSTHGDWPGFTAPSIVVRSDDTVLVAAGVSYTTYLPSNQGPTYFPILCFRFHRWNPDQVIVDTLAMFAVDTVKSLGVGSSVSLALDAYDRVHAGYVTNTQGNPDGSDQFAGHRYLNPGNSEWSTQVEVFPREWGYYCIGSPCLEFNVSDSYLYAVASAKHENRPYSEIYRCRLNVSEPTITDQWLSPMRISDSYNSSFGPTIAGGKHIFWYEEGELLYKNTALSMTPTIISHTPHAYSSAPQAVYDSETDECYVAWREANTFGSEIDLRAISASGLPSGGGQSSSKTTFPILLKPAKSILTLRDELRISYSLPGLSPGAHIKIYDCQGRLVRGWKLSTSSGAIRWNGEDMQNRKVGAGVYFIHLMCRGSQAVEKVLVVK